jgi:hypothetical protein
MTMKTEELELERDLKTLAESRPDDERLRLALRATLGERLQTRPKRRRPRILLAASAVAAATAAVAVVALTGTGGSGGPSSADAAILAHAARAISPPANIIVHIRETGVQADGTQVMAEWWQETNAPYAIRLIKGPIGGLIEVASDGTTHSQYDPATNTVYQQPDSKSPTLIDPIETVRAELSSGTAHVAGTVVIDGQSLYKIEVPGGVVGYFDRTDYRPVYLDNPQADGTNVRTRVTAYEELPSNAGNNRLLDVMAQHPDARIQTGPAPAPEPAKAK